MRLFVLLMLLVLAVPVAVEAVTIATVTVLCQNASLQLLTDRVVYEPGHIATLTLRVINNESEYWNTTISIELLFGATVIRTLVYENISAAPGLSVWQWSRDFAGIMPANYVLRARAVLPTNATLTDCAGIPIEANVSISIVPPPVIVIPPYPPPPPPPVIPPVVPIPPAPPIVFPPAQLPPLPGIYPVPPGGAVIVITGSIVDGNLTPGSVALVVFDEAVEIHEIRQIDPLDIAPLLCDQHALAAYELNITADIIHFCMNYAGIDVRSVYVWHAAAGVWEPLLAGAVWGDPDLSLICGNITARTPYMIAGFMNITKVATPESSAAAIRAANASITWARRLWIPTAAAEAALVYAIRAHIACDWDKALAAAEKARAAVAAPLAVVALAIAGVPVVAAVLWWRLRVRPRKAI